MFLFPKVNLDFVAARRAWSAGRRVSGVAGQGGAVRVNRSSGQRHCAPVALHYP